MTVGRISPAVDRREKSTVEVDVTAVRSRRGHAGVDLDRRPGLEEG
jgi:hypothetical protein